MPRHVIPFVASLLASFLLGACRDTYTGPDHSASPGLLTQTQPSDTGGAGHQVHFLSSGDFGLVSFGDTSAGPSTMFGFLEVSRGGPVQDPQVFLVYDIERCDPFCHTVATGSGTIPDADLTGSARNGLRLDTDISGNPNFFFIGPAGRITVDWLKTDAFSVSQSGTTEFVSGSFRNHQTGTFTAFSAAASGDVVGFPVGGGTPAQLGTNHLVNIDISH